VILPADVLDRVRPVGVLHRHFDPHLLPQNSPEHASSGDPQRQRIRHSIVGRLQPRSSCSPASGSAVASGLPVLVESDFSRLDAGKATNAAAPGVLPHRVRLQRMVYLRTGHQVCSPFRCFQRYCVKLQLRQTDERTNEQTDRGQQSNLVHFSVKM